MRSQIAMTCAVALVAQGCAESTAHRAALEDRMRPIAEQKVAKEPTLCVRLPFSDGNENTAYLKDSSSLPADQPVDFRSEDHPSPLYWRDVAGRVGALVEAGMVKPIDKGEPGKAWYAFTEKGKRHYVHRWKLCYGKARIEALELRPQYTAMCLKFRYLDIRYSIQDVPDWVKSPSFRAAFPEAVVESQERTTEVQFMYANGEWEPMTEYDIPYPIGCRKE